MRNRRHGWIGLAAITLLLTCSTLPLAAADVRMEGSGWIKLSIDDVSAALIKAFDHVDAIFDDNLKRSFASRKGCGATTSDEGGSGPALPLADQESVESPILQAGCEADPWGCA